MPDGDLDGVPPPLRPFRGFSSYADDTPRDLEDDPQHADPFDDDFDPFAPPHDELRLAVPDDQEAPRPRSQRFAAGAAAAGALVVVLGIGAGLTLIRGGLTRPSPAAPQAALAPPAPTAAGVHAEVKAAPEAPVPTDRVVGRLSELREEPAPAAAVQPPTAPGQATRAARIAHISPPAPPPRAEPSVPPPPRLAIAPPAPRFVDANASSPAAARAPAPTAAPALAAAAAAPPPAIRPSFDCREARTASQQMICSDPSLAAADRRMSRAYEAALAAGAPQEDLRTEQADWLDIREDAARRSKRAVMNIYEQRTEELEALAAQGPGQR